MHTWTTKPKCSNTIQSKTRNVGATNSCDLPKLHPFTTSTIDTYGSQEAGSQSWCSAYEKKKNVLQRALRSEPLFSLLWFIGTIAPSSFQVLNIPLICSSQASTWSNSLKMNRKKAKHWAGKMKEISGHKYQEKHWCLQFKAAEGINTFSFYQSKNVKT